MIYNKSLIHQGCMSSMIFKKIILHLSLIYDIGSGTIQKLLQRVGQQNVQDFYHFSAQDFARFGMSQQKAELIVAGLQDQTLLEKELLEIEKQQADFITILCEEYPKLLKQISVPPAVLYYQGDVRLLAHEKMFACVGARKAHSYAKDCLESLVTPMIEGDWVIVSGGAAGADTYAHQAALDHGGKTIVVVGSGLCHQYPSRNKKLFEQVVQSGGLIVSAFAMQTMPEARCFPIRNRIVSGLSIGCLVLQAASKSGALITAHFALEQGREVFAVPGPVYDPLSAGCHELIQQGAKLVTKTEDILQELEGFVPRVQPEASQQQTFIAPTSLKKKEPLIVGDEQDRLILQHTLAPITLQDLHSKSGIEQSVLHEKLFDLSLDGKVEQDCMGLWKRI